MVPAKNTGKRVDMVKKPWKNWIFQLPCLDTKGRRSVPSFLRIIRRLHWGWSEFTLTTGDIEEMRPELPSICEKSLQRCEATWFTMVWSNWDWEYYEWDIVCRAPKRRRVWKRSETNVPMESEASWNWAGQEDILVWITGVWLYFSQLLCTWMQKKRLKNPSAFRWKMADKRYWNHCQIENAEGVENIDEIIKAADGIMAARAISDVRFLHEVPLYPKMTIRKAQWELCSGYTATQIWIPWSRNPRPHKSRGGRRCHCYLRWSDAIMLPVRLQLAKYPLEALKMMVEIAQTTEPHLNYEDYTHNRNMCGESRVSSAVGLGSSADSQRDLKAKAIVTPTLRKNSQTDFHFPSEAPIYAVTPMIRFCIDLAQLLSWKDMRRIPQSILFQAMSVVRKKAACKRKETWLYLFRLEILLPHMTKVPQICCMWLKQIKVTDLILWQQKNYFLRAASAVFLQTRRNYYDTFCNTEKVQGNCENILPISSLWWEGHPGKCRLLKEAFAWTKALRSSQ